MTIGRNDPCPCGSGKKYKRCCSEKQQAWSMGTAVLVVVLGFIAVAAIYALWASLVAPPEASSGQVWSPEHGHYHRTR